MNMTISPDIINEIMAVLKRGDTVEIKQEQGKIVIVEIKRKVKTKTSITG